MITIAQGQVNNVFTQINSSGPVFLFALTNDFTFAVKYFICENVGSDTVQQFRIEESDTENLLNGVVTLQPSGFWQYAIYAQSSASNLDPANAILLERGKAHVTAAPYENSVYQNTSTNSVYVNPSA